MHYEDLKKVSLQPLSFTFDDHFLENITVVSLSLPPEWVKIIKLLKEEKKDLSFERLGIGMVAMHSQIFSYHLSMKALEGNEPWLYIKNFTTSKEEHELIKNIKNRFLLWVIQQAYSLNIELDSELLLVVKNASSIPMKRLSLIEVKDCSFFNKTFEAYLSEQFTNQSYDFSIESYRSKIDRKGIRFPEITELNNINFFLTYIRGKHSCVSHPFHEGTTPFSYTVQFDVVDLPPHGEKIINIKMKSKIWVTKSGDPLTLKSNKGYTYYAGFFDKNISNILYTFNLYYDKKEKKHRLNNEQSELFNDIFHQPFNLSSVLSESHSFIQKKPGYFGSFVYSPENFSILNTIAGTGLSLREMKAIYYKISDTFPSLKLVSPLPKMKTVKNLSTKPLISQNKINFQHFRNTSNKHRFALEIWTQDKEKFEKCLHSIINRTKSGSLVLEGNVLSFIDSTYNKNELEITYMKPELSIELMAEHNPNKRKEAFLKKVQDTMSELSSKTSRSFDILTLFEIPDYHNSTYSIQKRDPYKAIRNAFLKLNRHVQFINEINDQTVLSSLLDLLNKYGFHLDFQDLSVWDELSFYAFDKIKINNRDLNVLLKHTKEGLFIKEMFENSWTPFFKRSEWAKSFYAVKPSSMLNNPSQIMRSLQLTLSEEHSKKMLFLPAHLRKNEFPILANDQFDELTKFTHSISDLILIRTNELDEVPDYYGEENKTITIGNDDNDEAISQKLDSIVNANGVFKRNEVIFLSISPRGDQIQTSLGDLKINKPTSKMAKRKIIEFQVFGCEVPDQYAYLAHYIRNFAVTYTTFTNKPHPLYLIHTLEDDYGDLS